MRRNAGWKRRKPANQAAFLHIIPTSRLLEVLREDNRAVVRAASQASKAADWILGSLPDTQSADTTAQEAA